MLLSRRWLLLPSLFLLLNAGSAAQTGNAPLLVPCFAADAQLAHCSPVYVNVNVHLFVPQGCVGPVQQFKSDQLHGFEIAEQLINSTNEHLATNPEQWPRQDPHVVVCHPLRYVLRGVYAHCQNNVKINSISTLHKQYGIRSEREYNIYIGDYTGTSTGVASGIPGTCMGVENLDVGNFNHEFGHLMGLQHANVYPDDGCPDTNPVYYTWDKNCNGTTEPGETNQLCWGLQNGPECDTARGCPPCPCCDWKYQNNNVMMSKSAYQYAFSACQVEKMMTHLATAGCRYVTQVGGEAPPSAFITQTAQDVLNGEQPDECLVLSASYNDVAHSLQVYADSTLLVYDTGWRPEPAQNLCFTVADTNGGSLRLEPLTTYRAVLTVRNSVGVEDRAEYTFTTPGK